MARGTSNTCVLYVDKRPASYYEAEVRYAPEDWECVSSQSFYFVEECASIIGVMAWTIVTIVNRRDRAGFWEEGGAFVSEDASLWLVRWSPHCQFLGPSLVVVGIFLSPGVCPTSW